MRTYIENTDWTNCPITKCEMPVDDCSAGSMQHNFAEIEDTLTPPTTATMRVKTYVTYDKDFCLKCKTATSPWFTV